MAWRASDRPGAQCQAARSRPEQLIVGEQRLEHIELQFEPIRFLGVDGEVHIRRVPLQRQFAYDGNDSRKRLCAVREIKPGDGARSA